MTSLFLLAATLTFSMGVSRCERIFIGDACTTKSGKVRVSCCGDAGGSVDASTIDAACPAALSSDAAPPASSACERAGCLYKDKHYSVGESFRDAEECADCICEAGGPVACASMPPGSCNGGCTYEGNHYSLGESFLDSEACSECTCNLGGAVGCASLPPGSCDAGEPAGDCSDRR